MSGTRQKHKITVVGPLLILAVLILAPHLAAAAQTLTGDIVAADDYSRTITLEPVSGEDMGLLTLSIDRSTEITSCTQSRTFNELGTGQRIAVTYHEENGNLVADKIKLPEPDIFSLTCFER